MNLFDKALNDKNLNFNIIKFDQSTHTALQAATALKCKVGQIAKSLIFKTIKSSEPILVIASGANQVDIEKIEKVTSEEIEKATADFVKLSTGYSIGSVPPFGHITPIKTILDEDFLKWNEIWAAAGTNTSVFKLTPLQLKEFSNSDFYNIKVDI